MSLTKRINHNAMTNELAGLADAVADAKRAGQPTTTLVAFLDADAHPAAVLTHVTTMPSGKRYGRLSLGAAEEYLDILDHQPDSAPMRSWDVSVDIDAFPFQVTAANEEEAHGEAYEQARDMVRSGDCDLFVYVTEVDE